MVSVFSLISNSFSIFFRAFVDGYLITESRLVSLPGFLGLQEGDQFSGLRYLKGVYIF